MLVVVTTLCLCPKSMTVGRSCVCSKLAYRDGVLMSRLVGRECASLSFGETIAASHAVWPNAGVLLRTG